MSKRLVMGVLLWAGCGDDEADSRLGAVECAQRSVSECGQESSCQLLTESDGGVHCGEERIGVRGCDVMTVDECKRDARCQTIDGREFDEDRSCRGESEPLGCQWRGDSCPPAVIYARNSSPFTSYEFESGCVPAGFTRFQPVHPPQQSWLACKLRAEECEGHAPDECVSDKRCAAIVGAPLDETRQCIGAAQPLRCVPAPLGCTAALVVARDPQGKRWWFSSGCLPDGYVADSSSPAVNWPQCNPILPVSKACDELSGDECVAHKECRTLSALGYDAARMCTRGRKNVGCSAARGCNEFVSYGRDRDGGTWQFPDGCQPADFTELMPDGAEQPMVGWPACTN